MEMPSLLKRGKLYNLIRSGAALGRTTRNSLAPIKRIYLRASGLGGGLDAKESPVAGAAHAALTMRTRRRSFAGLRVKHASTYPRSQILFAKILKTSVGHHSPREISRNVITIGRSKGLEARIVRRPGLAAGVAFARPAVGPTLLTGPFMRAAMAGACARPGVKRSGQTIRKEGRKIIVRRPPVATIAPTHVRPEKDIGSEKWSATRSRSAETSFGENGRRSFQSHAAVDRAAITQVLDDMLNRQSRLPPAGMTGFDARLSPAWSGLKIRI